MTPPLDLSRRQFLTAASLTAGAALLAGCVAPPLEEGAKVARRVDDAVAPDARIHYDQVVILDRTLRADAATRRGNRPWMPPLPRCASA